MRHGFTNQKCPKCGGNTYFDMDYYLDGGLIRWYEQESCLQCGQTIYDLVDSLGAIAVTAAARRSISAKKEPLLI